MKLLLLIPALLLISIASNAQPVPDENPYIVRVTAQDSTEEVRVKVDISERLTSTNRTVEERITPFEITIETEDFNATFHKMSGDGQIVVEVHRAGERRLQGTGQWLTVECFDRLYKVTAAGL